ncbi:ABC transporter substrate-binding protein [Brevundimonas sp.]|uniref:ABC transporter substrate-binding protein n=1 Tax=Brevundimonas sp. TaxID=1871086 RepID=UPI003BA9928E
MRPGRVILAALIVTLLAGAAEADAGLRVMSLDQCADQYVLALAPQADLALSTRADDPDAWMRAEALGRRQTRATLEAAVAFRPDVVVRYWGGEPRLLIELARRGVTVLTIDDATDFDGIRGNVRRVAAGLNAGERGEALVADMNAKLARSSRGKQASAQYLTAGGFTAGEGTLINAMFAAAGLVNAANRPGYGPLSVERIALQPALKFVLGFFDQLRSDWRGAGRHPVVRRASRTRTVASLSAAVLTCPAWFAADGVAMMAAKP